MEKEKDQGGKSKNEKSKSGELERSKGGIRENKINGMSMTAGELEENKVHGEQMGE